MTSNINSLVQLHKAAKSRVSVNCTGVSDYNIVSNSGCDIDNDMTSNMNVCCYQNSWTNYATVFDYSVSTL